MTTKTAKSKQILAREILLFFCALLFFGLIWGFLVLRNTYLNHKIDSHSNEIKSLQNQLDTLPTDYVQEFYNLTNKYFVINFKLGKDTFTIAMEQAKDLVPKKISPLQAHSLGYSYFKQKDPIGILPNDSVIVFDYAPYNKFHELISSDDYQNKLFAVFSSAPDQNGTVTVNSLVDKPTFDPMKPYNGILDLGTLQQFKTRIRKGLNYNEHSKQEKQEILQNIKSRQQLIEKSSNRVLDRTKMRRTLLIALIAIGVILYPARLSVYSITWAIKTLKKS